jgi:glycosyltransferase involved in cell wall biosynthesis
VGRSLTIGLYSQFFGRTVGGGEKYLGVTAEAIREAWPQHRLELVTAVPADRDKYERELNLDLDGVEMEAVNPLVGPVRRAAARVLARVPLYRDLLLSLQAAGRTRRFDLFLPMVYVHPVFSRARRTVILCQFPYRRGAERFSRTGPIRRLYRLPYRALRAAWLGDELARVEAVICQSEYVASFVQEYWDICPAVVAPPIDIPDEEVDYEAKAPIVLGVGRFFRGGHNKRHDVMIEAFKGMCHSGLTGWELHLAGSVHDEGASAGYFGQLQDLARGYPIHLHGDMPRSDLQELYRKSSIFWHAAGYLENGEQDPANLEHFGMTTVEAMAYGAVPVVIAAGGQVEVVDDGVHGLLWTTTAQLKSATARLIEDLGLRQRLARAARARSHAFSRDRFKAQITEELRPFIDGPDSAPQSQELDE